MGAMFIVLVVTILLLYPTCAVGESQKCKITSTECVSHQECCDGLTCNEGAFRVASVPREISDTKKVVANVPREISDTKKVVANVPREISDTKKVVANVPR